MPRRVAISTLNASTIDIINTIRANAPYEYQNNVPAITSTHDIPRVGEVICGYPAFANHFLTALVNRIASVQIKSATFNNAYAMLKKGYLEFGETVEEVFVTIAKAREFSAEKAEARELKRSIPDVRTAFHVMNYRVQYPVTIQDMDLRQAFTSANGVQDLIARIVDSVYTANEYDEFLLFKYMLIKAVAHGKMHPIAVDDSDIKNSAVSFRGTSNLLPFISNKYNVAGVHTATPKADQLIFMSAEFNAKYDVNVLASAFNMDKADFMGRLHLIDDWTTFDNDRFSEVRANSDGIEEVTSAELALMSDVQAILVDKEWFQFYDNLLQFTEKYVASGMYWNYFLNVWKTISFSPFSNAVVFVADSADTDLPATLGVTVLSKDVSDAGTVFTIGVSTSTPELTGGDYHFVQTNDFVTAGVAVHPYGAIVFPASSTAQLNLVANIGETAYTATTKISTSTDVGDTFTLAPASTVQH